MAERTGIAWATATWNSWFGCNQVSPACDNCYALRQIAGQGYDPHQVRRAPDSLFYAPLSWQEPQRIFTCSWSDFFHEGADEWRPQAWDIIKRTPNHRYLILTKRPERIADHLPDDWSAEAYSHVALGVTVENQGMADRRIPILLDVPVKLRFISCEPLLEPLNLGQYLAHDGIGWVICGGESIGVLKRDDTHILDVNGQLRARFSDPAWFDSLRLQCGEAKIPYFLKQLGQVAQCDCGKASTCERCRGVGEYLLTTKRDHGKAVLSVDGELKAFVEMPNTVRIPADDDRKAPEASLAVAPQNNPDATHVAYIELDKIDLPETQVRKAIRLATIKELKESIYRYGLLEPIVVAKNGTSDDGTQRYKLLHGQRRLLAMQKLHKEHADDERWVSIPCLIREQIPEDKVLIAEQLIENIQREDLTVFDRAEAIMQYRELLGTGTTWAVVEKNLGISQRRREQILRVLKLPVEVRVALRELGRSHGDWHFTERHARELMRLQYDSEKLRELTVQTVEGKWGLKQLKEAVNAAVNVDQEYVPTTATPTVRFSDVLIALKAMSPAAAKRFLEQLHDEYLGYIAEQRQVEEA